MRLPLICVLVALIAPLVAQQAPEPIVRESLSELGQYGSAAALRTFDYRDKNLRGSPFLFPDWRSGEIQLKGKKQIGQVKYDAFKDLLLFRKDSMHRAMVLENVPSFLITESTDALIFKKLENQPYQGFYQLLLESKVCVYKKYRKKLIKGSTQSTYSTGNFYDEFKDDIAIYLKNARGEVHKVTNKSKLLHSVFTDHSKQVKAFMKQHQLSLKNEKDIMRLVAYYNQLP